LWRNGRGWKCEKTPTKPKSGNRGEKTGGLKARKEPHRVGAVLGGSSRRLGPKREEPGPPTMEGDVRNSKRAGLGLPAPGKKSTAGCWVRTQKYAGKQATPESMNTAMLWMGGEARSKRKENKQSMKMVTRIQKTGGTVDKARELSGGDARRNEPSKRYLGGGAN